MHRALAGLQSAKPIVNDSSLGHNSHLTARGDLDQAEALLKPLVTRKCFNIREFGFLCMGILAPA